MDKISPAYTILLVQRLNERLFELYKSYELVEMYILRWHEFYGNFGDENFPMIYKDVEQKKLDVKRTLCEIDGETILKMAIDLGIETPDFIPSIPIFRNELKSSYSTASQTFEKAFKNIESDSSIAIGLANSALESIIKEILCDKRINVTWNEHDTLSNLIKSICKAFKISADAEMPNEIKTISSSLLNACKAIEDLRSDKTLFHGKTNDNYVVSEPLYAYFIVNSASTIGLFLLNFYKLKYPSPTEKLSYLNDEIPF